MTDSPTAPSPAAPATDLGARYGRRPGGYRRLVVSGVVLAVALVAWLGWTAVRVGDPEISYQDVGFSVISDGQAQITFRVRFAGRVPAATRAACTVQAQNVLHTEIGRKDVTVGPARERRVQVTAQLPTSERANSVTVTGCALL
ncbi:DUF4307 domain-containing protein [Spongisporangium articulatum]|uniref:DUF4307 domain-containing protein n=1 Tax=Spongisporangium articulatum TaxID=3362603 RepID=A0ABW8ASN8_9ACTN